MHPQWFVIRHIISSLHRNEKSKPGLIMPYDKKKRIQYPLKPMVLKTDFDIARNMRLFSLATPDDSPVRQCRRSP